jgi:uncharacterized protein YecT (DUF1311 family)
MNLGATLNNTTVSPRSLGSLGGARITGPLRLASYFTPTYPDPQYAPVTATISAEEARTIIDGTLAASAEGDRPSFDCAKAAAPIEQTLCGEYESELRSLDRALAEAWAAARRAGKGDLAAQRRWLASRDTCEGDRTCLADLYQVRIAGLRGAIGPGIALAPGETVTYEDDIVPLPDAMRRGPLYERIVPVLSEASGQAITLTGNPDGSIAVEGSAVRANAHTCELGAPVTRFDSKTGWWSAKSDAGVTVPLFRVEGRRIVLRYSGNSGNTPEEAGDFMSCGMRAFFDDGIDLTPR